MPKVSKKSHQLPLSPIRKLSGHAEVTKSKGIKVLHLNIGQPDMAAPRIALDAVENHTLELLPYGPTQGSLSFRSKLCSYYSTYGIHILPEEIMITTGASEAFSLCMNVIFDVKDEIIVPEPFYANYNGFAAVSNVSVIPVVSHFHHQFKLPSISEIKTKITPKTRAILICNPSNPTGYVYSKHEIEQLGNLAVEHDIFLLVDEVYREFIFGDKTHYSVLANPDWKAHAVMIDSVSKRYSLCGARIGCIVSRNREFMNALIKYGDLRLSPPTLAQIAAEAALDTPEQYIQEAVAEYAKRKDTLIHAMEKIPGVQISRPVGAFFCIAKLPVTNAEDFCRFLLTDFEYQGETVMLAPACGFYATPGQGVDEVRVSLTLNSRTLGRAAVIIQKALWAYQN